MLQNFANLYKPSRNAGQFLHFHPGKSPGRGIMPCAIGQLEQQGGADMVKNDSRNFFFHGLTAGPARAAQNLCLSKLRGAVAFASFAAAHVVGSRARPGSPKPLPVQAARRSCFRFFHRGSRGWQPGLPGFNLPRCGRIISLFRCAALPSTFDLSESLVF